MERLRFELVAWSAAIRFACSRILAPGLLFLIVLGQDGVRDVLPFLAEIQPKETP